MMRGGWRTDVEIVDALRRRIKQHADNPVMRATYETALAAMLASNPYLAGLTEPTTQETGQ